MSTGTGKDSFYLVYRRDPDKQPITDVWIKYGGPNDVGRGMYEPVPTGFGKIDMDSSIGAASGRDVSICFRKARGLV